MNAIMNKNCSSLEGCRIYTTLFPCNECAKLIVQSRMREVVYLSDAQRDTEPNTACAPARRSGTQPSLRRRAPACSLTRATPRVRSSRRILNIAGVEAWQHAPAARQVVIDFDDVLAK